MDWALGIQTGTAEEYIKEAHQNIRRIRMLQEISECKEYLKWLTDHWADLNSIAMDMKNSRELRDEATIRASEVEYIALEIAAALNEGAEYADPNSMKSRLLREKFEEIRNAHAASQTEGGRDGQGS